MADCNLSERPFSEALSSSPEASMRRLSFWSPKTGSDNNGPGNASVCEKFLKNIPLDVHSLLLIKCPAQYVKPLFLVLDPYRLNHMLHA